MPRDKYKIFSQARLGAWTLSNRLVRSSTWDPSIFKSRRVSEEVLNLYRDLALGGVGLIIAGGLPVFEAPAAGQYLLYDDLRIEGLERMADVVHRARPDCRIVAQLETGHVAGGPSDIPSPFRTESLRPLTAQEIETIIGCFVQAIVHVRACGFDGVQLHAAHGGLLSCFLSPHTNRRQDAYGGSVVNRVRIVSEIVAGARRAADDFPILIKMNCTDYVEGGIEIETFPELAQEVERAGVDAIEVSGGMWDCLARSEAELGFRPVPSPESHTRIHRPEQQSYFLKYAERLNLNIPVILVGGNRDIEHLEAIVQRGQVDFIALCRPLISEPDLPRRWLADEGRSQADCIACNACIYNLFIHPGRPEPGVVTCVFKHDKPRYKMAQEWLASWVEKNRV